MKIIAIIGNESHSTSSGWASISVGGKKLGYRNAISHEFKTHWGDKHKYWVECVFEVQEGEEIKWEAGANSGPRGKDRRRQHFIFIAHPNCELYKSESLGHPCSGSISGKIRLAADLDKIHAERHAEIKASVAERHAEIKASV